MFFLRNSIRFLSECLLSRISSRRENRICASRWRGQVGACAMNPATEIYPSRRLHPKLRARLRLSLRSVLGRQRCLASRTKTDPDPVVHKSRAPAWPRRCGRSCRQSAVRWRKLRAWRRCTERRKRKSSKLPHYSKSTVRYDVCIFVKYWV